jgi:hypothetical protein
MHRGIMRKILSNSYLYFARAGAILLQPRVDLLPLEPAGELEGCGCAHLHLCRWMGDIHQGGS